MLTATQAFLEPLENWANALRRGDFPAARRHAQHLLQAGELLAIHPNFRRCFQEHCQGFDPELALVHLCQFLVCATDGRARMLTAYLDTKSPPPVL